MRTAANSQAHGVARARSRRARGVWLYVLAAACTILFASTSVTGVAAAADASGFSVAPLRFDVEQGAGSTSTHEITIRNVEARPVTFTFGKEDFEGDADDPNATPRLLGGELDSSISGYDWITGYPGSVTIPARGSRTIDVKVSVPDGASGGHYAALVIEGPQRVVGSAKVRSRVAVLFLMNAGNVPPPEIVIDEITTTTDGGTIVTYVNEGETDVEPEGTIEWEDPVTGEDLGTDAAVDCTLALPGGSGVCTFEGGGDTEGSRRSGLMGAKGYVELATAEGERARAELPTTWAGTWTSMLLPLVGIALFVLYFVFLRRRRREEDAPPEALV